MYINKKSNKQKKNNKASFVYVTILMIKKNLVPFGFRLLVLNILVVNGNWK